VLFDGHDQVVWRLRVATPGGDYAGTVRMLADLVAAARQAAVGQPFTVGMGTPGTPGRPRADEELQLHLPERHAAAA
jgi:predicted NBD/HSP70 family sugar kinase